MTIILKPKLTESTETPAATLKGVEYVEIAVAHSLEALEAAIAGAGDNYALLSGGVYHVCERQP